MTLSGSFRKMPGRNRKRPHSAFCCSRPYDIIICFLPCFLFHIVLFHLSLFIISYFFLCVLFFSIFLSLFIYFTYYGFHFNAFILFFAYDCFVFYLFSIPFSLFIISLFHHTILLCVFLSHPVFFPCCLAKT